MGHDSWLTTELTYFQGQIQARLYTVSLAHYTMHHWQTQIDGEKVVLYWDSFSSCTRLIWLHIVNKLHNMLLINYLLLDSILFSATWKQVGCNRQLKPLIHQISYKGIPSYIVDRGLNCSSHYNGPFCLWVLDLQGALCFFFFIHAGFQCEWVRLNFFIGRSSVCEIELVCLCVCM